MGLGYGRPRRLSVRAAGRQRDSVYQYALRVRRGAGVLRCRAAEAALHYGKHILPHDVDVRELGTGKTRKEIAQKLGIKPLVVARVIFSQSYFDEEKCVRLITDLQLYRKKWDEDLGVFRSDALHDEHAHGADAFRSDATVIREGFSYDGSHQGEIVPQDEEA